MSAIQEIKLPHQHVAGVPCMPIDEALFDRVRGQRIEQRAALRHRTSVDVRRVLAHEQRLLAGLRDRPHQKMGQRRRVSDFLRRGQQAQAGAGQFPAMDDTHVIGFGTL